MPYGIGFLWNLEHGTNELIYKTEIFSVLDIENKHGCQRGRDKLGI